MKERDEKTRFREKGVQMKKEAPLQALHLTEKYRKELVERQTEEKTAETSAVDCVEEKTALAVSQIPAVARGSVPTKKEQLQKQQKPSMKSRKFSLMKYNFRNPVMRLERLITTAVERISKDNKRKGNTNPLLLIAGSGVLLPMICALVLVGGLLCSPFGILFVNEPSQDAVPLGAAVADIQSELSERLENLQNGDYDRVEIEGNLPDWCEVVAVFACKATGAEESLMPATLESRQVNLLRRVFWDMCHITSEIIEIEHDGWAERVLCIDISAKTAEVMSVRYRFDAEEKDALTELLTGREDVELLLQDLHVSQEDARELLQNLPDDLSPERRAVVETACQLVGKVNYFWGGKSLVIGWDSRWGRLQMVTAAGSPSTNTYRPYGLDCSGFVDWVFYNATDGEYILGHGGGAIMQHRYCEDIPWSDAQPGDLVFYPDDSHVGIVGGRDENGELLIIHCTSGSYDNVVITGKLGFEVASKPFFILKSYAQIRNLEECF